MSTLKFTFSLGAILFVSACGGKGGGKKSAPAPAAPPAIVAPAATTPPACGYPSHFIVDGEEIPFNSLRPIKGGYGAIYEGVYSLKSVTVIQNVRNTNGQSIGSTTYNFDLRDSRRYLVDKSGWYGSIQIATGGNGGIYLDRWCSPPPGGMAGPEYSDGFKHSIVVPGSFFTLAGKAMVRNDYSFSQILSVTLFGYMNNFQPAPVSEAVMKAKTFDEVIGNNAGHKQFMQFGEEATPDTVVMEMAISNQARTSGTTKMWVDTYTYAIYSAN
ncbi:MAG: hypothetical protein AB7H97_09720 [Pseudobdellovibrionaceae bacterium]